MVTSDYLVNPSRVSMEEMGTDLRGILTVDDELWVWPTEDGPHHWFAEEMGLCAKAWLYIYPQKQQVEVSVFSHAGVDLAEAEKIVKAHPRFKFFELAKAA